MERILVRERGFLKALLAAVVVVGAAFSMVVIVYGLDSIAPGVHDAFHNFRHVLGMPCH